MAKIKEFTLNIPRYFEVYLAKLTKGKALGQSGTPGFASGCGLLYGYAEIIIPALCKALLEPISIPADMPGRTCSIDALPCIPQIRNSYID